MELDPRNHKALELLLLAAPSFKWGFNLQAVLDLALLMDLRPSTKEILRVYKAWVRCVAAKDRKDGP